MKTFVVHSMPLHAFISLTNLLLMSAHVHAWSSIIKGTEGGLESICVLSQVHNIRVAELGLKLVYFDLGEGNS